MDKKKQSERQSLLIATVALVIMIITGIPAEITIENPHTILAIVCYAAASIYLVIQWIRFSLKYRNKDEG